MRQKWFFFIFSNPRAEKEKPVSEVSIDPDEKKFLEVSLVSMVSRAAMAPSPPDIRYEKGRRTDRDLQQPHIKCGSALKGVRFDAKRRHNFNDFDLRFFFSIPHFAIPQSLRPPIVKKSVGKSAGRSAARSEMSTARSELRS